MAKYKQKSIYSTVGFKFLILITVATLSVLGLKTLVAGSQNNVLGAETFIAEGGSDSGSSGESSGGTSGDSNQPQQTSLPGSSAKPPEPQRIEPPHAPEPSHALEPSHAPEVQKPINPTTNFQNLGTVRFTAETGKSTLKLDSSGAKLELKNEDGKLTIKAKSQNGTETELENESLDKVNEALHGEGLEVATASGKGFIIKKGQFQAETHFPISINPTTNALTITTPAGEKTVTVLPDQAVNNLLGSKLIDRVASEAAIGTSQNITLGIFNNTPAFQVKGIDDKKLLGFLPISIDKTNVVSAQTGQVLQSTESFLNNILDLLSVQ